MSTNTIKPIMLDDYLYGNPIKSLKESLTSEFDQKLYAINNNPDRISAEKKWNEVNRFMSSDVEIYKNRSEYTKRITDPTSTTINYMEMIYNANLKDLLVDGVVDFNVKPDGIPEKYLEKELEEPMNLLGQQVAAGGMSPEDALAEGTRYRQELIQNYIKNAGNFGVILHHIYDKSNPPGWSKRVIAEALKTGNSCVKVFYDVETPDEVKVSALSCWDCYREPNVTEFQQANYFIVKRSLQITEFLSNKEWLEFVGDQGRKNIMDMFAGRRNEYNINYNTQDPQMQQYNFVYLWEYHKKYIDLDGNLKIGVFYFVGNPYLGVFEPVKIIEDTKMNLFNFVWLSFKDNNNLSIYGDAPMLTILPAQKDINRLDKIKTTSMLDMANAVYIMAQNSGIDVRQLSFDSLKGPIYLKSNAAQPSQAIAKLDKGEMTDRFLQYKQQAVEDVQKISNTSEANQGMSSISGAKQGAVALNSANAGSSISALCKEDLAEFNKNILKLLMRVIFTFQMDSINFLKPNLGSKEKYQPVYGSWEDYAYLDGYVNIKVDIMTASERNIQKQEMITLLPAIVQNPALAPLITGQNLARVLNWGDREQAIQRLNMYASTDTASLINQAKALIGQNMMIGLEKATQQSTLEQQVQAGQITEEEANKTLNDMPDPMPDDLLQQKLVELFTKSLAFQATFNTANTMDSSVDIFSPDNFAAMMSASITKIQSDSQQVQQQLQQAQQQAANTIYQARNNAAANQQAQQPNMASAQQMEEAQNG